MVSLQDLTTFLADHPTIPYILPSSPEYDALRTTFVPHPTTPLAIVRPTTPHDVAIITSFLISQKIPFTVRCGGHDIFGRAYQDGAVALDLRLLNHVQIDRESGTARVGGGILIGDLVRELQKDGLMTAVGLNSTVGYVGWAMYGGYGTHSPLVGLGVDQIVSARVVNAQGEVEEAEGELLKAIRGAAGSFGVVVEVTVRVFSLEKIFAGVLTFQSDDLHASIRQFNARYRELQGKPSALALQQVVTTTPIGPMFMVLFMWNSHDLDTGKTWLQKIESLAPVTSNSVQVTTPTEFMAAADQMVPKMAQGRVFTVSLRRITEQAAKVIAEYTSRLPDQLSMFSVHELRADSPSARPRSDSVFAAREPHFLCEILCLVKEGGDLEGSLAWGAELRDALRATGEENILPTSYISFLPADELDVEQAYGPHYQFLRELKQRRDPDNVFQAALSGL